MNREAERKRLVELLKKTPLCNRDFELQYSDGTIEIFADHLLANGVKVTPFVAMVEQFMKGGKFDRKTTLHNGKYAVVYIDKSKWGIPLIDITEAYYNADIALERIKMLKGDGEK